MRKLFWCCLVSGFLLLSGCSHEESMLTMLEDLFKINGQDENTHTSPLPIQDQTSKPSQNETEEFLQTFWLTHNSNVRKGPSTSDEIITVLNNGTEVTSFEQLISDGKVWYHVIFGESEQGWISSSVLTDKPPSRSDSGTVGVTDETFFSTLSTDQKRSTLTENTIQTYNITLDNGKITISGTPTEYGAYYNAKGIILDISESRSNTKVTERIPFQNGKISYTYTPTYPYGEIIINLDEYYDGKEDDPNKVLGHTRISLKENNPYLTPSHLIQSDHPAIQKLAKQITQGKNTNKEKSKEIFKWVAENIRYDTDSYFQNRLKTYSALETLESRIVMCTGYANLSASLHRAVGIEAKVVYGEDHAWNEIFFDGAWQVQDPTFGSGYVDTHTKKFYPSLNMEYFSKVDKMKEGEYNK